MARYEKTMKLNAEISSKLSELKEKALISASIMCRPLRYKYTNLFIKRKSSRFITYLVPFAERWFIKMKQDLTVGWAYSKDDFIGNPDNFRIGKRLESIEKRLENIEKLLREIQQSLAKASGTETEESPN